MLPKQTNPKTVYDDQIIHEIQNISEYPLTYSAAKLLEVLDEFELDPYIDMMEYTERYATIHLLAYIINLDFNNAKFLYKRLEKEVKENKRIEAVAKILKTILQKRYADVLTIVRATAESLGDKAQEAIALLNASIPILRSFILRFLVKTFETIPLTDAAKYLDLNVEDAFTYLIRNGWKKVDEEFLKAPEKIDVSDREFRDITEAQFKNLSQTISFLETF